MPQHGERNVRAYVGMMYGICVAVQLDHTKGRAYLAVATYRNFLFIRAFDITDFSTYDEEIEHVTKSVGELGGREYLNGFGTEFLKRCQEENIELHPDYMKALELDMRHMQL